MKIETPKIPTIDETIEEIEEKNKQRSKQERQSATAIISGIYRWEGPFESQNDN